MQIIVLQVQIDLELPHIFLQFSILHIGLPDQVLPQSSTHIEILVHYHSHSFEQICIIESLQEDWMDRMSEPPIEMVP